MKNKKVFQSLQRVNSKGLYLGQQRTKIIIASTITQGSSCYRTAGETFLLRLLGLCSYNGLGLSTNDAIKWHTSLSIGMGPILSNYLFTPVEKS